MPLRVSVTKLVLQDLRPILIFFTWSINRKNHQRQLDSLQQALDIEQKAKTEQSRQKKKAESDFAELESQIDTANRVNGEQAKTVKKLQQQIKELQSMLDDEQRAREDGRDVTARSERRCNDLAQELDELKMAFEQVGNMVVVIFWFWCNFFHLATTYNALADLNPRFTWINKAIIKMKFYDLRNPVLRIIILFLRIYT